MGSPYLPSNQELEELWGQHPFPGWLKGWLYVSPPLKIPMKEAGAGSKNAKYHNQE